MAKLKKRFITINTRGPIWEFGGCYGPMTIPFKCDVKTILRLIKSEKLDVYGTDKNGNKVKLDENNYDNDGDNAVGGDSGESTNPPNSGGSSGGEGGSNGSGTEEGSPGNTNPLDKYDFNARQYINQTPEERKELYCYTEGFDSNGILERDKGENDDQYIQREGHVGQLIYGYTMKGYPNKIFDKYAPLVYNDPNKPYLEMGPEERKKYRGGMSGFDADGNLLPLENESVEDYKKRYMRAARYTYDYNGKEMNIAYAYPRVGDKIMSEELIRKTYSELEFASLQDPSVLDEFKGKDGFDENGRLKQLAGEDDVHFTLRKEIAGTFGFDYTGKRVVEPQTRFAIK